MIALSLSLLLFLPQEAPRTPPPQQPPPQQPTQRNPILEGVAVQAGEKLVTLGEFERRLERMRELDPPTSRATEERLYKKALLDLWTARLEAQRGADLGLDPSQIARISRANLEAERDKAGLQNYLAQLRTEGSDALTEEADRQQEILGAMWQYKALGNSFAGRRATRDFAIRPGELRALFEENRENLAPVTVQLRILEVSTESAGGSEQARASCADARERVLAGEDLALLVEERGVSLKESRGLLPFRAPDSFPEPIGTFARTAEIGDLSEVLPALHPKTGLPAPELGYLLILLDDREVPPEPEFDQPDTQRRLRRVFVRQRQELILDQEREQLHREAFAWVNPLAAPPPPSGAPAAR